MIAPGGITPFWIGSGQLYSSVVQQALDNYTGLSAKDLALINSIITNLGSNYDLIDEIFLFVLGSNVVANGSIGLKGTVGDNSSGGTFDIGGILSDGVAEFFDTTIVPSTDLTFASQDDIDFQCFVTQNLDSGATKAIFGAQNSSGSINSVLFQDGAANLTGRVNVVGAGNTNFAETDGEFQDEILYGVRRDESANQEVFKSGAEVATGAVASGGTVDNALFVGSSTDAGGAGTAFINAKIALFSIEASIGFDNSLFNTVIRNSLTAYGTI